MALYLTAHVAFHLRNVGTLNRQRLMTATLLFALIPLATHVAALLALAGITVVSASLIAYEALRFREARAHVRAAAS